MFWVVTFIKHSKYINIFFALSDSQPSRSEALSTAEGPGTKLHNLKTESISSSDTQHPSQESAFRRISALLELGIVCLPGNFALVSVWHENILFCNVIFHCKITISGICYCMLQISFFYLRSQILHTTWWLSILTGKNSFYLIRGWHQRLLCHCKMWWIRCYNYYVPQKAQQKRVTPQFSVLNIKG